MAIGNRLLVVIDADVKGAIRELDKLGNKAEGSLSGTDAKIDKFANNALKFGAAVTAGAAVAGVGLYKAAQQASDLNESITKSEVVFGRNGQAVVKWAGTLADSFGLSKREALAAAGGFGSMFRTTGLAGGEAAKMSKRMTELAGDMASFNNEDPSDMLDRLRSGLAGEAEPLRRFGVLLSEARVQSFAYANGIAKSGEALTESQKVQARYGLILKDTKLQQGDFARTADGAANSQRAFNAQIDNLVTSVGQGALPILKNVTGALADIASKANEFDQASGGLVGKIATIGTVAAGAVGGVTLLAGAIAKVKSTADQSATAATALKGIGIAAGAITGIVALIGVVDLLKKAFTDTRTAAEKAADAAKLSTGKLAEQFRSAAAESNKLTNAELRQTSVVASANKNLQERLRGLDQNRKYLTEFKGLAENNIGTAQRLYEALRKNPEAANEAGINLGKLGQILKETTAAQRQANSDTERGTRAVQDNAKATQESTDSLNARRTALLASFDSEIGAAQAVNDLSQTLKESNDPLAQQASLLAAAGAQAQAAGDRYETLTGKTFTAEQKQQAFRDALIALGTQFPQLAGQVNQYLSRLDAIPPTKTTTVTVNDAATANLQRIIALKERAGSPVVIPVGGGGGVSQRRAGGGPVSGGTPYLVGEKGPEIFMPSGSGRILSAKDSAASLKPLGGSGGGAVYQINVTTPAVTADTGRVLVEHIRAYERNSGSRWRQN